MKSTFGKSFSLNKEGVFLLSLPIITIAYQIIKPGSPFELVTASLLLFLIAPFFITRFIFEESILFLGFRKGNMIKGVSGVVLGWIIFYPIFNLLADQKDFQSLYPPFTGMGSSPLSLIFWEIVIMLPAFIGVQTFIYGYAYEGFRRIMGRSKALLLLIFVGIPLFYIGRLPVEIILASFAGLITCWIKNRSHSILYPILFGWGLSVLLDALVVYKLYLQ